MLLGIAHYAQRKWLHTIKVSHCQPQKNWSDGALRQMESSLNRDELRQQNLIEAVHL